MLGVPCSTFYAWRGQAETPTQARRRAFAVEVDRVRGVTTDVGLPPGRGAAEPGGRGCSVGLVAT